MPGGAAGSNASEIISREQACRACARLRIRPAYLDLTLNGRAISDRVLDPAFTDYSKTVLYATHDVTGRLRDGENVLAAELGSGHFDDATRTWDWGWEQAEWRGTPRLRINLWITYADGSEEVVTSDES
jgi:alpha-L-rhamnosidase